MEEPQKRQIIAWNIKSIDLFWNKFWCILSENKTLNFANSFVAFAYLYTSNASASFFAMESAQNLSAHNGVTWT
jgi:hypothetical protein